MKIKLKRNFYAPNAKLYRAVKGGTVDIPAEFCKDLPKDAEFADKKDEAKIEAAKKADEASAKAGAKKADAKKAEPKADAKKDKSAEVDAILGKKNKVRSRLCQ